MTGRELLLLLTICLVLPVDTPAASTLEFVYLESNVGSASGGHVALKLDDQVYHYQNDQGYSRLTRDDWEHFRRTYNDLENRTLHLAKVSLQMQDAERIRDHLSLLYLIQNRQLDFLSALERDIDLLKALQSGQPATLPGIGFFSTDTRESPVVNQLRAIVESELGTEFIKNELTRLADQLTKLKYGTPVIETLDASPGHYPLHPTTFSEQFEALYARWFALKIMQQGYAVRKDRLIDISHLEGIFKPSPLMNSERAGLTLLRRQLIDSVLTALKSQHTSSSSFLLLAIARFQAISMSLDLDSLLLIDVTPHEELSATLTVTPNRRPLLIGLRHHLVSALPRLRRTFSEAPEELSYHQLERSASTLHEVGKGLKTGLEIRFSLQPTTPKGMGKTQRVVHTMGQEELEQAHEHAQQRRDHFQKQIEVAYAYRLIDRNCVTELVRAMNAAFPNERDARRALGGLIVPGESQGFIPFRFFELVRARYPLQALTSLPSFRIRGLQQQALHNASWPEQIGETIVPLARLYQPRPEDSAFLLFTDDTFWPRPLFGTINLLYAMGATSAGLFMAPLDQGDGLKQGLRGALFSLPELLFWNIRKGSYEAIDPTDAETLF